MEQARFRCPNTLLFELEQQVVLPLPSLESWLPQCQEIMIFNAGVGDQNDGKVTVTVEIGTAAAYVQVARENVRPPGLSGQ